MYEALRSKVLALLKVPPEPHPPMGDPASLRVFRAGRNYLRLRLAVWTAAQVAALAGIVFWTTMLVHVESTVHEQNAADSARPISAPPPAESQQAQSSAEADAPSAQPQKDFPDRFTRTIETIAKAGERAARDAGNSRRIEGWIAAYQQMLVEVARLLPEGAFPWLWVLKVVGIVVYLIQLPLTYVVRRLDYEMRWYMVTDRSLRLRHGVLKVFESTMSFANIQQVDVSQGPLQRVLGLANVRVKSAGGGTGQEGKTDGDDMHTGLFHSVTNAEEIRDLILNRLRRYREAGLGDPDEKPNLSETPPAETVSSDPSLAAAQELLREAKALRAALH